MIPKGTKICLVCGKEFKAIASAMTCGGSCRIGLFRMMKENKKPDFWLMAKNKGQRIPDLSKPNVIVSENKPQKKEVEKEIKDTAPISLNIQPETIELTAEQKIQKRADLFAEITKIGGERCPMNKHPKMFALEKESRIDEINEQIKQLA